MDEYRIPTSNLPKCSDTSKIKFLGLEDTKAMLRCQADFASRNHGMVVKFEDEIRAMASDSQSKRIGFIEDGQLKGYAVYDFVSESEVNYTLNRIEVSELVYLSPAVLRAFLGFFPQSVRPGRKHRYTHRRRGFLIIFFQALRISAAIT